MPSNTRVHNSYIKVNNCKKKTFWDQNLSFAMAKVDAVWSFSTYREAKLCGVFLHTPIVQLSAIYFAYTLR